MWSFLYFLKTHSGICLKEGSLNYDPQATLPGFVKSFIGAHSFVYILIMAASLRQWQCWVAETETVYLPKPKLFTIFPFTKKKFVNP